MAEGGWWGRLKQNVGLEAPEEEPQSNSLLHHLDEVSTLNRTQAGYSHIHQQDAEHTLDDLMSLHIEQRIDAMSI